MDIIEHYIKNSSLVEIPFDYTDLLNEAIGIESLLRSDGRMDTFIDKLEMAHCKELKIVAHSQLRINLCGQK